MARLKVGQKTCTGTGNVLQITATPIETSFWHVKALTTNSGPVEVGLQGFVAGQGYVLTPGEYLDYEGQRTSGENVYDTELREIYVLGANGDKVTWLAHQV